MTNLAYAQKDQYVDVRIAPDATLIAIVREVSSDFHNVTVDVIATRDASGLETYFPQPDRRIWRGNMSVDEIYTSGRGWE